MQYTMKQVGDAVMLWARLDTLLWSLDYFDKRINSLKWRAYRRMSHMQYQWTTQNNNTD